MTAYIGAILVVAAGLSIGTCAWPVKVLRRLRFEHWWFAGMLTGLVIVPWTAVLAFCPHWLEAYRSVPACILIKSNLCSLAWGVANLLCGILIIRVGVALTGAFLTGLGVATGATLPMIAKGSGLFSSAPDIGSPAGLTVLIGVAAMLLGVMLAAAAGLGRDRALRKASAASASAQTSDRPGGFALDLGLCVLAGVASCGFGLAFVYGQGPIVAAMKARGAADVPANLAVWAAATVAGALINIVYPGYLIARKRSWGLFWSHRIEVCIAAATGIQLIGGGLLMGKGMLLLGALGGSVGYGIQQVTQMLGNQGLGFASGEWTGVHGSPRRLMLIAIAVLIAAAIIMAYGNKLA